MSKLPILKSVPPEMAQIERLELWLMLWYAQNDMEEENDDVYTPDGTITEEQLAKLKTLVNPFDTNVQTGEIRLLSSAVVPDSKRPYYAAIIKQWDDDVMLIAPYAPFTVPATTGELKTGRKHFSLATLELWNARTVPTVFLRKSWLVDKLTEGETDDAFAVFAHASTGNELPEKLADRIGLPIVNPKDPRIEYQRLETELLTPLLEKSLEYEKVIHELKLVDNIEPLVKSAYDFIRLPQAAKSGESASKVSRCIHTKKSLVEIFKQCVVKESKLITMSQAKSITFDPINPESTNQKTLLWELPEELNMNGDELLFVLDMKSNSFVGIGEILEEDRIIRLTKISSDFIKRKIAHADELLLIIGRG